MRYLKLCLEVGVKRLPISFNFPHVIYKHHEGEIGCEGVDWIHLAED
jgi:hypothetical protein